MADSNKPNSFVENVNIVANATVLATGDIIEDTRLARDEAVAAAKAAHNSELGADDSENKAQEWAENAYNSPVEPNKFSSFHWSEKARLSIGDPILNDSLVSLNYVWSSQMVTDQLAEKSGIYHTHENLYEKKFAKQTGFNKPFGGTGTLLEVAHADHDHLGDYEPGLGQKNTAFNKNFGTASGEVAEGDHLHTDVYMQLDTFTTNGTVIAGAKLPWVADVSNPLSNEVPRGTHTHLAESVPYDNTHNTTITSGTVQGAINQLDSAYSILEIAEKTHLTAGISQIHEIPIVGIDTAVKLNNPLALQISDNASITNGAEIVVKYSSDTTKLIDGIYSISVVLSDAMAQDIAISVSVDDVIIGEHSSGTSRTLTFSKHLVGLPQNGFRLSAWITNRTDTSNIFIDSMNIMWVGAPEGALVASGISVDHADITGTGAANGVHTISDIQGLTTSLDDKADKAIPGQTGNFALLDATGNLIDSGIHQNVGLAAMNKVQPAALDNIIVQTTLGDAKDGGMKLSDLALVGGNQATTFKVKAGTGKDAVNKDQLDSELSNYGDKTVLDDHLVDDTNPHSVTYTQVGAAAEVHTHVIASVTGLSDELSARYSKVTPDPATNNIVLFETGGLLKDSGITTDDIVGTPDETGQSFKTLTNVGTRKSSYWSPFVSSPNTVSENFSLEVGQSASIVSPILNDGVTITIPDGSTLVIL